MTKVVFVQTKEENMKGLGSLLGSIQQDEYHFVVLPMDTKLLTKEEVRELLEQIVKAP